MPKLDLKPHIEVDDKGRIVLPKIIRDTLQIKEGTILEAEIYTDKILLTILK